MTTSVIDNRQYVRNFLETREPLKDGEFYPIRLIMRRKDGHDITSNAKIVAEFEARKSDDVMADVIQKICDATGARAYINLNRRNDEAIAMELLRRLATNISTKAYATKNLRRSVVDSTPREPNKLWVIDYDFSPGETQLTEIFNVSTLIAETGGKTQAVLATPNGLHVIMSPFNRSKIAWVNTIRSDGLTVLYAPSRDV